MCSVCRYAMNALMRYYYNGNIIRSAEQEESARAYARSFDLCAVHAYQPTINLTLNFERLQLCNVRILLWLLLVHTAQPNPNFLSRIIRL